MGVIGFALKHPFGLAGDFLLRRKKRKGPKPYSTPFSYTPNESDPELLLRRRRALEEIERSKYDTLNEINRAGLLGSSAGFGVLGEQQARSERGLENITADVFAKRRMEALDLYRAQQDYLAQLEYGEQAQRGRESLLGLSALGYIGEFGVFV